MPRALYALTLAALCLPLSPRTAAAADTEPVDFARQILPILSNKCFACHGPDTNKKNNKTELRLDSYAAATTDHDGTRAIHPEDPSKSEIHFRLHDKEDPMPPEDFEKQLTADERGLLDRWVKGGGAYADHWAFVPPRKTPGLDNIDAYVGRQLEKAGLDFAPEAERATLARRVALVLNGLPPDPEQLSKYLADDRPEAYAELVEALLASPRFGEHQARYWLDAVRYGDTHGLHLDNRRGIFPYRDWVVRAFNKNLPLDKFVTWQVAGDLLPEPTLEQLVATGFVRMNPTTAEGGAIAAEFQAKNNFDRTETFGTALLGMTLTCARCHTHKYDPIHQKEYYEMLAFFNSTAEHSMDGNKYDYAPVIKAPASQAAWDKWEELVAASAEHAGDPAKSKAIAERMKKLEAGFTTTLVAKELPKPRETKMLRRGEYNIPYGEPLQPKTFSVMGPFPEGASPDRLGLAKWLTGREQPLVARVLINRIWGRTFGEPLVRTPEDFGLQGEQPTHPELLDWLAVELHDSEWDLKHLLRLMVHSRTFKQDSKWREDLEDPENRLLARGQTYRLDAEVLRDTALWASNLLDAEMGGEGVKPYQPAGMWSALMHPASNTKKYVQDKGEKLYRRSLYVYWKRTSPHPMMTLFDAPDRETSCVRRSRSNTSLQSLGLLNETQRIETSRKLAERLMTAKADDDARLDYLFGLVACRKADKVERAACGDLLKTLRARYAGDEKAALALLATGEAPRDEKLPPAELAAWSQVVTTVLASDAAILIY